MGPLLELVLVPLDGILFLRHVNHTTQLGVICKSAEGALDPTVYAIDEDIKQHWSQHLSSHFSQACSIAWVVVTQVQDPALSLVEPHTIGLGPSIQPSLPTLKQINTPTQLGVICKLTEGALNPLVQIIDKDIKQNWPQY
ncbi:hypothetical protein QYF61_025874 [Mycteria americana]|uniref:Uncharacterized protein n=1 Tax=Mycteria americana TaxID=33587 RepID=A0AAN7N349_MYCAM|nr:hypothetical protein QYF61_025874 [Mycteria americana]